MLEQTQLLPNHTSKTKVYFNEFFENVLGDNIGSKTNSASEKKLGMFFSWLIFNKFLKKLEHKEFSQANHLRELCGFQSQLTSARLGNQSNYHQFNSCWLPSSFWAAGPFINFIFRVPHLCDFYQQGFHLRNLETNRIIISSTAAGYTRRFEQSGQS